MTDPIADMLTRIRNAIAVRKETVEIPYSKIKYIIANILLEKGFVEKVEKKLRRAKRMIIIKLKYEHKEPAISGLRRISKPGRRVYSSSEKLKLPKGGRGIGIISTSQGVMTIREAKKRNLGGEIICEIW